MRPRTDAPLTLYGLKTCDTCRKALKTLRDAGYDVRFYDVRADGLTPDLVARFHTELGDALVNKSSTTWRNLDQSDRSADPVTLLSAHPTAMTRPVIDTGDRLFLGWKNNVIDALI